MKLVVGKTEMNGDGDGEQLVWGGLDVENMARCVPCARALTCTSVVGAKTGRLYRVTWNCSGCGASLRSDRGGVA